MAYLGTKIKFLFPRNIIDIKNDCQNKPALFHTTLQCFKINSSTVSILFIANPF